MLMSLNKFRNRKNTEQFFSRKRKALLYEYGSGKKAFEDLILLKEDLANLRLSLKCLNLNQETRRHVEALEKPDRNQDRNLL